MMNNARYVFFVLLLISIFVNISIASNTLEPLNTNQNNEILLKNAVFDTSKQPPISVKAKYTTSQYHTDTDEYYILQFKGNILEKWIIAVENTGAIFFDYIPNNAFIVRMNSSVKSQVEVMDIVQWIGPYQPAYKISSVFPTSSITTITTNIISDGVDDSYNNSDVSDIIVMLFDSKHNAQITSEIEKYGGEIIDNGDEIIRVRIETSKLSDIAAMTGVSWIEKYVQPVIFNDIAANITNVYYARNTHGLDGSGQIVAVADSGLDTGVDDSTMHDDIEGRIVSLHAWWTGEGDNGAADYNGHGTHVAGSVLGNGANSNGKYAGMAPMAQLVFQALQYDGSDPSKNGNLYTPTDLSSLFQQAYDDGAKIHSNSWGSGSSDYGDYTSQSQHVDSFMWNHKDMSIFFSAGNDGASGNYTISPPSTAKNALTVGSSQSSRMGGNINNIALSSSRGFTDDGRIKPDIVAPGTWIISTASSFATYIVYVVDNNDYAYMSGTSMATPITAGTAALVRQYYVDNESISPSAALIKATLINGAVNMGLSTNEQGWGRVDIEKSLFPTLPGTMYYHDIVSLTTSQSWNVNYYVNNSSEPLSVTLVWTDYPSATFVGKTLVNDLDLKVTGPDGSYHENGGDSINNVEQVKITSPAIGLYTITINGANIPSGPQPFAIVASGALSSDTKPPLANDENPVNISYTNNNTTSVSINITDTGSGVNLSSIGMSINDNPVGFTNVSIHNGYRIENITSTPYDDGLFKVSINVCDNATNSLIYNWSFTIDATPPTSNTPTNIEFSANISSNFTYWKLYDLHPAYYWVLRNDTHIIPPTEWQNNTNITVPINTSIGFGDFNYTIQYNDSAGNYGTPDTVMITINDTTPPSAFGEIPANGSFVNDITPLISVNITDNASGVNRSSIVMTVDGSIVDIANTTIAGGYIVSNQTATPYAHMQVVNVTVNATDNNSNFISYNWSFTVDGNAPVITDPAAVPTKIESNGIETTNLSVNVIDYKSRISSVTINLSSIGGATNVEMQNNSNNYWVSTNATGVGNGVYYLPINATDNAGNSNTSVNITLYVNDTTPPTLSNSTPATGASNLKPTISINATDIGSGINVSSANMTMNGLKVLLTNTKSVFTYNFSNTTTTPYNHSDTVNVTFNVSDKQGHTTNYSWMFYIDNVAPTIIITSPADNYLTTASSITVSGAVNGTGSPPIVMVNDVAASIKLANFSGTFTATSVPISLGTNTINANVIDAAGNVDSTSISVIRTSPESPPSSGGGGGGGGATGEPFENIAVKDVAREYVVIGSPVTYTFKEEINAIGFITYDAKSNPGEVAVMIEVLKSTSAMVSTPPSGEVYQNMNIWVGMSGYATEKNIGNPIVGFRVARSWITENNIDESTIKLNRYNEEKWNALKTTKTDEDAIFMYFESQTPGFSPFAITAQEKTPVSIKSETAAKPMLPVEGQLADIESVEETPIWPNLLIGALILTIIAGAYMYIIKR